MDVILEAEPVNTPSPSEAEDISVYNSES